MRISNETKEQIRKSKGKFFANVSKVKEEKIISAPKLFSYMKRECPTSLIDRHYNLYDAMALCDRYRNEYWYVVFKFAMFSGHTVVKLFDAYQRQERLKSYLFSNDKFMEDAFNKANNDLDYMLFREV